MAEAIEQEHRRIRAMDAQRRQAHLLLAKKILIRLSSGESLPSNQLVDFNENIDSLDWVAIAEKVRVLWDSMYSMSNSLRSQTVEA